MSEAVSKKAYNLYDRHFKVTHAIFCVNFEWPWKCMLLSSYKSHKIYNGEFNFVNKL